VVSFGVTFLVIVICVYALAKILEKMIKLVALGMVNRITGALFGGLKLALILGVMIMLIDQADGRFQFLSTELKSESVLYNPMLNIVQHVIPGLSFTEYITL